MKPLALSLLFLLVLPLPLGLGQQQSQVLTVFVTDGDGRPKPGITVTAQAENFRETAVTNSSGLAVLRQLTPGTYDVVLSIQNVELLRRRIEFPATNYLSEVAPLSKLTAKVVDVAGRPVPNIFVTLTSPRGSVSVSQRTNGSGYVVFNDVPFSTVQGIGGPYSLKVTRDGITVVNLESQITGFSESVELLARLVNVNFTFTDIGGSRSQLEGTLTLSAKNFTQRVTVSAGRAEVTHLISSAIVGGYNASLSTRLGNRAVVVYSSALTLESYADLVLRADVAELKVRIVDPSNLPVKGVGVLVGAAGYGNFSSGITDDKGEFNAGLVPSSAVINQYQVSVFRGRTRVLVEPVSVTEAKTTAVVSLPLQKIVFNIQDFAGRPLADATLTVKDPVTARVTNTTVVNGRATVEVFAGANEVTIIYKQTRVFSRVIELSTPENTIQLRSVNFPVTLSVLDALGRPVENLRAVLRSNEKVLLETRTSSSPVKIELELPTQVVVDLYSGDNLLIRDRYSVDGPFDVQIRLTGFAAFGDSLLPVDVLVSAALALVLAILAAFLATRLLGRRQR